jgi:polyisoprenoid-binding protein YceI
VRAAALRQKETTMRGSRKTGLVGRAGWAFSLVALFLGAFTATASAQAREFRVGSGSRMQFVSDAPLERITGVSTNVSGTFNVDPTNLSSARGSVQVPISSIRTGLDLRDEHLHGSGWLDAGRFPNATLEITSVEGATALTAGAVTRVTIRGRFTVHGVTRDVSAQAQVRWIPASAELRAQGITGDLIRAQATFTVNLPDHNVSVNPLVRLKVSDQIRVNVTIRAVSS